MSALRDPDIYFHIREGRSQLYPVWRGPFPAVLSIGAETGAVSIMSVT